MASSIDPRTYRTAAAGELVVPDQSAIDKLVRALVRIRSVDTLEGAIITRHWLAADMRVNQAELDRLLKLLRWQNLVDLPNEHLVVVKDHEAMREIALGRPVHRTRMIEDGVDDEPASATTDLQFRISGTNVNMPL